MLASGIKATVILADHAQVADGKLNVIGGGWTVTGPGPAPFALAALIEFPWGATGENHTARFELVTDEGVPVNVTTEDGEQPLFIEAEFPVAAAPGVRRGTPLTVP